MSTQSDILAYLLERSRTDGKNAVDAAIKSYKRMRHPGAEKTKRVASSDMERNLIYEAQRGRCANPKCRRRVPFRDFHIDHYTPLAASGSNESDNKQGYCGPCNLAKSSKDPVEWSKRTGATILESMPKGEG